MSLKDQLKSRPKGGGRPLPQSFEVTVDNDTATAMVEKLASVMLATLRSMQEATQANAALLAQLAEQMNKQSVALAALAAKESAAPTVVMPERPGSFEVDITNDDEGKPSGMRIVAKQNLH